MKDVMIDIETLGQEAGCVISSISAIEFDINTGELGKEFHRSISIQSCVNRGLKLEPNTFLWWFKQGQDARMNFLEDNKNGIPLPDALREFGDWIASINATEYWGFVAHNPYINVWSRGPRFDLAILSYAYKVCGWDRTPWDFRNERCVRTMEFLCPEIKEATKFEGVLHNGIDDSKQQIKYVSKIYQKINSLLQENKKPCGEVLSEAIHSLNKKLADTSWEFIKNTL